ncbi:hypothetical protein [Ferruginibacter sp.]
MNRCLLIALLSTVVFNSATAQKARTTKTLPAAATENWQASAQQYLAAAEYHFKKMDNCYATVNRRQKLSFVTDGLHCTASPLQAKAADKGWQSKLTLTAINAAGTETAAPKATSGFAGNDHLLFHYDDFSVEYLNDEQGMRQNFIINKSEDKSGALKVILKVDGDLVPAVTKNNTLELKDAVTGKTVLKYDDLKVWDARNTPLNSSMELSADNRLQIVVDDAAAVYPVTVDPLTHLSEWETSASGLLPGILTNLQLQVDAMYGYSVAGLGDVNGDGFDDVAIGAPGAIDIVAGPTTVVGAGAVFVYFGSAAGLPSSPSRVLRATTPVTNALFGFSIAGGNVTGNTVTGLIKNDIIVGAPGDTYSTSVSGVPSTATVTAGKVYVFDGLALTSGPASPLASVYLNGSAFFSNGVIGVLLSNVNINALFGFSVAAADDMDGDGLGEVVVGAPGYAGVQLLDVVSGAAFVYKSGNIVSNTPTQLATPTLLGFPGLTNINGLLFGFSVDGAGDYNKDSKPDVVVGAPGGLNLGGPGFLGGTAYVYNGNGAGVNSAIGTQLTTSGPLLGSVANLFGYCVKGVKDANGNRTGSILVGAPVGNVLSNVVGGLRLKTGSVNLFQAKLSPAGTETPNQSFSSPRSASLLSILSLQNLDVNAMFGASIDNMLDVNCDGFADIIVGEPLSSAVGLIGANALGGATYVFLGNAGNTYTTTPHWTLENEIDYTFGLNAASLIGFSVAGGGHVAGVNKSVKAIVGATGKLLDFSTGIFNIGNTFGTIFGYVAGGNGLGRGEQYTFTNCSLLATSIINFTAAPQNCDAELKWSFGNEDDLAYTEVQQSNDGVNFTTATKVMPQHGDYKLKLAQVSKQSYYRLRIYEKNGTTKYSNIEMVKTTCNAQDQLSVLPSVFTSQASAIYTTITAKGTGILMIQDVYGRTVSKTTVNVTAGSNRLALNTNNLPAGVYYVSVHGDDWKSETIKVIKQK